MQPAALPADDVRAAVRVLRRPARVLRCRRFVQFLPQQHGEEAADSTHRHRSVLRVSLLTHPARHQRQVRNRARHQLHILHLKSWLEWVDGSWCLSWFSGVKLWKVEMKEVFHAASLGFS